MQGLSFPDLRMLEELCGENNLKSVILVTTHWIDDEGNPVPEIDGEARMKQLAETKESWGGMIEMGSTVDRHDGSERSARKVLSYMVD